MSIEPAPAMTGHFENDDSNLDRADVRTDSSAAQAGNGDQSASQPLTRHVADLQELLRERTERLGDKLAYVFLDNKLEPSDILTYAGLYRSAYAIAQKLRRLTQPGDRVLLAFNNHLEAVQLFWGCILAGTIPIPAPAPDTRNSKVSEGRLRGVALDAQVALALTHESHVETGRMQILEVPWHSLQTLLATDPQTLEADASSATLGHPSDIAYLQYTSGSTSAPRGVEITHGNVLAQCTALMDGRDIIGKQSLIWLPWFHDYGLVHGVIQPLFSSGTAFLMSTLHFLLRPLTWLQAIEKHRITHSGAPNFAYVACVQALARKPGWSARLDSWQLASCGAEPVRSATLEAFATAFAPFGFQKAALAPSYGLAEAVLAVTVRDTRTPMLQLTLDAHALERQEVRPVSTGTQGGRVFVGCGTALPGFQLRIVDPDTRVLCEPNRVGEIWLAGPSVGQGYWMQPEATAEHFGATLADQGADSTRYLRTGDLGFMHGDELFIAGRRKDLIIANGRNLYPQDLEQTAEIAHPGIRSGSVFAISVDMETTEKIVLLLECSQRFPPDVVRELIGGVQKLVGIEHQVDVHDIVPLRSGTLPRTSSGKPRRSEAKRLYLQGDLEPLRLEAAQAPPDLAPPPAHERDEGLIDTLTPMWLEVLGHETVELDANFFDLGGDSLLATQLVSRIRKQLGVELPISALFETPTLRGLTGMVLQAQEIPAVPASDQIEEPAAPSSPRAPGTLIPLSFSQERMWFMHEMAPNGSAYNIPLAIRILGPLNMDALNSACARLFERHEILRTRFVNTADGPKGEVVVARHAPVTEVWLRPEQSSGMKISLHEHLANAASAPFRLDQCPLIRMHVFHTGDQEAVLLIVMHHIIGDQWSCAVLLRELAALFNAAKTHSPVTLDPLKIQYADYAASHRSWFMGSRHREELAYWSTRLAGLEPVSLSGDFSRPRQPSFKGAALRLPFSKEDFASLASLGAAHHASLSMVLIAALKVLLLRHTGKTDIAIGVPIANRNQLASESLIGTFVNTLVFRTDLQGSPSFVEVLTRVRHTALEAYAHQDMPFELLVRELKLRSDPSRSPLFSVAFNLINSPVRDVHFLGLECSRMAFDRRSAQFDLSVNFDALFDPSIVLEYATDLFDHSTIERMGEHLLGILRAAIEKPDSRVSAMALMGKNEQALLNLWSHGPRLQPEHETGSSQLSAGLRMAPNRTALVVGETRLSHRELDQASNQLARALRGAGVGRGSTVGLCMPRVPELIVALLATLKAGAAYLPLDPAYPEERLSYQAADAGMKVLLTSQASESVARALFDGPLWVIDKELDRFKNESPAPLDPDAAQDARSEDPAYLIYTSGSTGQPKGVVIPHRALTNLITSLGQQPGMGQDVRLLAVTTLSFDIAVTELLLPLAYGATVVMATEGQAMDGRQLAKLIEKHDINVMQATPSRWNMLLDTGWQGKSGLRALVTGEPLPRTLAQELSGKCSELWNMYGPTETTVFSSGWPVDIETPTGISLGRPIANTTIDILDAEGMPCPIGVMGEIWIGGAGLALGYHERQALTAARFVDMPRTFEPGKARMYRTGDFGRWRWDGSLEHGGRMDDQVKLRGFRIELGEVEATLASCPGVQQAVVALREVPRSGAALVAYIVPTTSMPALEEVRQHLRKRLPDYMVPTVLVRIDQVPVLANGKTNRSALPPPERESGQTRKLTLPRTHAEQLIWSVWSDLLETRDLSVHDDFFDIGGHSLLVVKLAGQLEQIMRKPISLGLLFTHTTIEDMAAAISAEQEIPDLPAALLQPLGDGPPLFLLAGADMYRSLAHQLSPDLVVYGLFSQKEIALLELTPDQDIPPLSVESLASDYLALIRSICPHGPYLLGGFSIGGIIAYEVARRLRAQGEKVEMLVLLDCALPGQGSRNIAEYTRRRFRQIRDHGLKYLMHASSVLRQETIHRNAPGQRRNKVYSNAIKAYQARPCDAPVLLVQSEHDPYAKPGYGWEKFAPHLMVERVPGRHMDILEPGNAALVARHLKRKLLPAKTCLPQSEQPEETLVAQSDP